MTAQAWPHARAAIEEIDQACLQMQLGGSMQCPASPALSNDAEQLDASSLSSLYLYPGLQLSEFDPLFEDYDFPPMNTG